MSKCSDKVLEACARSLDSNRLRWDAAIQLLIPEDNSKKFPYIVIWTDRSHAKLIPKKPEDFKHSLAWPDSIDFENGIVSVSRGRGFLSIATTADAWQFNCITSLDDFTVSGIDVSYKDWPYTDPIRLDDGYKAHSIVQEFQWEGYIGIHELLAEKAGVIRRFR
jgi:hypothetical protein